jgi:hypothetical protein
MRACPNGKSINNLFEYIAPHHTTPQLSIETSNMSSVTYVIPLDLLQDGRDKHPFSVLTEIHQRNYLDRPMVLDETRTAPPPPLTVGVNSPMLGMISVTGSGQTKAAAKTEAAALVLDQLRFRK